MSSVSPPSQLQAELLLLETLASQTLATKYYAIAAFTFILYDYCLTLGDEVKTIWKQGFSIVTLLFFLNRYYTILVFSVVITGFFSPLFTPKICARYSLFIPFGVSLPLLLIPGLLMTIRVWALYQRSRVILSLLLTLLAAQVALTLWIYTSPGHESIPLPDIKIEAVHLCILIASPKLGLLSSLNQWAQTVFDTVVFALTIYKSIWQKDEPSLAIRSPLLQRLMKDGVLYFAVIFTTNLVWVLMIMFATPGLKYINGGATLALVSVMMNRSTINIRSGSLLNQEPNANSFLSMSLPRYAVGHRSRVGESTSPGITDVYDEDEISEIQTPLSWGLSTMKRIG